jgi:chromosome segregation ATPase
LRIEKDVEVEKSKIAIYRSERDAIRKDLQKLQMQLAEMRKKTDVGLIQEMEVRREKLAEEINTLRQKLGSVKVEYSTLQSKFDSVLRVGYENSKIQLSKVEQQQRKVEKDITEAIQERESLRSEIAELEKNRIELSHAVLSAREDAKKFTTQIDAIDSELRSYDAEYEQAEILVNQLKLSVQTCMLKLQQYLNQLKQYGYEQPLAQELRAYPGKQSGRENM